MVEEVKQDGMVYNDNSGMHLIADVALGNVPAGKFQLPPIFSFPPAGLASQTPHSPPTALQQYSFHHHQQQQQDKK